jgi:uncharacterized protein YdiU (UPF0061 family)
MTQDSEPLPHADEPQARDEPDEPEARRALEALEFDNRFVRELPSDPQTGVRRRQVPGACYSWVEPEPVAGPALVAHTREMTERLGLSEDVVQSRTFAEVFGGNRLLPGMQPYATRYGGHQFGNWAGQLGDGRAINLGEVLDTHGARWEMQLKGAGPTPYARMADGRAVLRSSVREFLCSEAMHHLGVPTTRALSLVTTGDHVTRDMFYDGNPQAEPGAVVCRMAPSFLRFGNYEILAANGEIELLERLVDHTIRGHFPELGEPGRDTYLAWLREVCRRTAVMIAEWMRVGFVHGVMNTDNMSVLGLTIDYGPYGWLEGYDPRWTPNTTDASGRRYCYGNQPRMALWNLTRFAEALSPLIREREPLEEALGVYTDTLEREHRSMMASKLGLQSYRPDEDDALVEELFDVLELVETDMTIFYRRLADVPATSATVQGAGDDALLEPLRDAYYAPDDVPEQTRQRTARWIRRYLNRVLDEGTTDDDRRARMNAANPKYVLRNYLAQLAIDRAEQGDGSLVRETLEVLRHPYDERPGKESFAAKRPEWARHRPGCSMLSCSS